uniref:Immunoglobulin V-set domain-containing protein n=1 Tax=Cyprinus carpio TaxID=7962 RepID=A0A8C2K8R9_CYPCA
VCRAKFYRVFADSDAVKSVSIMEGDSVSLQTNTKLLAEDLITWTFGLSEIHIAQIIKEAGIFSTYDGPDGRFRDRLKLKVNNQTGSLTITNTRTTHSGLYQIITSRRSRNTTYKFNVTVFARLPVPVFSRIFSSSSSSSSSQQNCSLVCSAVNVGHVTLSCVSDLSISLSLPLEVEYQDKITYTCVLNNPISNQTQHLDITQLCYTCSGTAELILAFITPLCGILDSDWPNATFKYFLIFNVIPDNTRTSLRCLFDVCIYIFQMYFSDPDSTGTSARCLLKITSSGKHLLCRNI